MSIRPNYWKDFADFGRVLGWIFGVVVAAGFIVGTVWCNSTGCAGDPERARKVLEGAGYTNIEVGGANAWRCDKNDGESNTFSALGPTKRRVDGVVCCSRTGCGKGCTIRMEP